jgi:hypothetical protein
MCGIGLLEINHALWVFICIYNQSYVTTLPFSLVPSGGCSSWVSDRRITLTSTEVMSHNHQDRGSSQVPNSALGTWAALGHEILITAQWGDYDRSHFTDE